MSSLTEKMLGHPRQIKINADQDFVLTIVHKTGAEANILFNVNEYQFELMSGKSKISLFGQNPKALDNSMITIQNMEG